MKGPKEDFYQTAPKPPRALCVGAALRGASRESAQEHLEELALLAETDGMVVVGTVIQARQRPDPATLLGKGKIEEIAAMAAEKQADWLLFDEELTPTQQKNIEKQTKVQVMDRTGLILDIFALRARTREAKTQVELAQHEYMLPRLTGLWTHFSKQKGGVGIRSGEGESQLEIDRRIVKARISQLKRDLARIGRQHAVRKRGHDDYFRVALVGYTNAGKSSLLNALTRSAVLAENRLFATLDATTRRWALSHGREVLLTDTVGFIRKLPHQLVASFRSTLAEAAEADLLLHVVDLSHNAWREQVEETRRVLAEIGADEVPEIVVFNKIDRIHAAGRLEDAQADESGALAISALSGQGLRELREVVEAQISGPPREEVFTIPAWCGEGVALVYRRARVVAQHQEDGMIALNVQGSPGELASLAAALRNLGAPDPLAQAAGT
ncbi:MAG: GTPase HflX [Candidatus Sericytochromatia bacterium]|nr:GTPase HflX [Candidatus Tanganyikabacteria bacterium]